MGEVAHKQEAPPPKNIYQRINEVRKAVDYIMKDAKVSQGGAGNYPAVTHDNVTGILRNHLIKQCIITVPTLLESSTQDIGKTKSGTTIIRYSATYDVTFINGDAGPSDSITIRAEGHANDSGDKAPGKALSYVVKYALLKLFNIPTGENEESRYEAYAEPITEEQAEAINERLEKLGKTEAAKFMKWAKIKHVEDLGQPAFEVCIEALDKKIAKQEESDNG